MFSGGFQTPLLSGSAQIGFTQTRHQHSYSTSQSQSFPSPALPVGENLFGSNPTSPGFPGYQANNGFNSSLVEGYGGARVGSPNLAGRAGGTSKKQLWLQQAFERTRNLQSGSFQQSALDWLLVQPNGNIPQNAINLGSEGQPMYLCRSFYEDQLRVGRVTYGAEGLKAFIICKGKEIAVKEYEILIQAAGLPQFSFVPGQKPTAAPPLPVPQTQQPVSKPINPQDLVDIVFIVDDSDSMLGERWTEVQSALAGIPQACQQVDADGFDLFFLNSDFSQRGILNSQSVSQTFQLVGSPDGATPTGYRLSKVLELYLTRLESRNSKAVSIVVITDGDPTDDVESVIVQAVHRLQQARLSPSQLSIHFVQIGDDQQATDALEYLDNNLESKYQIPDIVETTVNKGLQTHFTTETLTKVLQTLWTKQTIQTTVGSSQFPAPAPQPQLAAPVPHRTATPSLLSPVSPGHESNNYFGIGHVQSRSTATTTFSSRKEWIQQAKQLTTNTLTAHINPSSLSPFTWIFVESGVPPVNAIVVGKENEQDTFFVRSFYEGHLRYGTIASGASKAVVVGNNSREVTVDQYEVLVQASGFFYSFVAGPSVARQQSGKTMDIVLVVDDSDSMAGSRWDQARDALAAVAEGSPRFDDDGVDLYFLNSDLYGKNIKTRNEVIRLFNSTYPDGATPTGKRLQNVLNEYIPLVERRLKLQGVPAKPVSIIVITDGDPTDDVESVIVDAAQRLHRSQVPEYMLGIQFVQIGNDPEATLALQTLDRGLHSKHGIRDMVDTTPYDPSQPVFNENIILKIVLGGLDRKVDRIDEQLRISTI